MSDDLADLTLEEAARRVAERSVSPVDLVEACLARIEALEPVLNCFITLTADAALASARAAERELASGAPRSPLHGIPIALKDLYETAGVRTTAGSPILAEHVPTGDAATVARLRESGAVLLGKTNLHEWAFGVTNDNPHFGPTANPWAPERISGGSSGGSAAALAARMCFGALGTDTGGSVRIPASLCGIVGLKPTFGRVSVRGVIPLSWTLDHAGPMARSVRDCTLLFAAIAGHEPEDPTSADVPFADPLPGIEAGVAGMRLGIARGPLAAADPEVADAVRAAVAVLASLGAEVVEVDLPRADELAETQRVILSTDAAAFHRDHLAERPTDIGADVLARLRGGERTTGTEYAAARRRRDLIRHELVALLDRVDALLLPTTAIVAPPREGQDAVAAAARLTALTSPFNLTGLPALSVPCGFSSDGLPVGLQIAAGPWREDVALRVGRAYERATDWGARRPPLAGLAGGRR
ncbi:MAG TPA: amidase [Candidatus Limnocylindrales bacterium]|nr:amidase [Candidatus Limnocylindrales bacterium]